MDNVKLIKANELDERIIKQNGLIHSLKRALKSVDDGFVSISTNGMDYVDAIYFPANIFKPLLESALFAESTKLNELKKQFDEL